MGRRDMVFSCSGSETKSLAFIYYPDQLGWRVPVSECKRQRELATREVSHKTLCFRLETKSSLGDAVCTQRGFSLLCPPRGTSFF